MEPSPFPDFHIAEMQSLSLAGSGRRRAIRVPPKDRPEGFDGAYDDDTLWYDAVRIADEIRLVMPRLYNLASVMTRLRLGDGPQRAPRVQAFRRHEIGTLKAASDATRLSVSTDGWTGESGISPDGAQHFSGLNASLHISRNNDLQWIADWARFHVAEHGLDAMLLMDNASDAYVPEEILEALHAIGLKRAVVLKVPQPYGPPRGKTADGRQASGSAKFLQPAMLNLARLRFLRSARAVLNADIDELVWTHGGSIFDATVASHLGLISFDGRWRMPATRCAAPFSHADHTHLRPKDKPCPTKYCIAPRGLLGRFGWDVHRLETWLPVGRTPSSDFGYWHCRGITTNWKSYARLSFKAVGPRDASTAAILERVFANTPPRLPPTPEGETVAPPQEGT